MDQYQWDEWLIQKLSTFLIHVWPYANYRASKNTNTWNSQISDVTIKGKGKTYTGVDIQLHTYKEYSNISKRITEIAA